MTRNRDTGMSGAYHPIRECYYPSRGCEHNEASFCDASDYLYNKCKGEHEDWAIQHTWEQIHEPPEDSEFNKNSEEVSE